MAGAVDTYLKWPKSKKAIVWLICGTVIAVVYYFAFFQPRIQALRSLEAEYDKLGNELRENQAIADNLSQVKEEVQRLDQKLAQALEKLPNKEEIPSLLQTVSDLGKESGLEFLLFKPAPPVAKDFYAEVPLELQILGRYHDLAIFFDKIGRLPRIVTIEDIDFGGAKSGPGGVKLTVTCKALTFKFLEPGEVKQAAEAKKQVPGAKKSQTGGK